MITDAINIISDFMVWLSITCPDNPALGFIVLGLIPCVLVIGALILDR